MAFPAVAVLALGLQLSFAARADAQQAARTRRDAGAVVLLGRLHSLVVVEQGMAEGLLQLGESGYNDTTLSLLLGFDLDEGRAAVDASIDATAAELQALEAAPEGLASFLAGRSDIVERALKGSTTVAEIRNLYQPWAEALDQERQDVELRSLSQIPLGSRSGPELARSLAAADRLAGYIGSSAELARLLSVTVRPDHIEVPADAEILLQVGAAWREERDSLADVRRNAGPSLAAELEQRAPSERAYGEVRDEALVLSGLLLPSRTVGEFERLSALAAIGRFVFAWLDGTSALYEAAVADVQRAADAVVDEARRDSAATTTFTLAVLGACLLGALTVSWSILAPLGRVSRRAAEVRDGDLHGERLAATGPREVAEIAGTIEEMADNLRLLEAQSESLAAGRLYDPVLHSTVPGRLGTSFKGSIERLTEVTERLAEQARVDPLTGLGNRAAAIDQLQRLLDAGTSVGVLFIDLDGFKAVNDSFGHAAGDKVLVEVARRLRLLLSGDSLVARLGGDEFLLLVPGADEAAAAAVGATVIDAVSRAVVDHDHRYVVAASVGVALGSTGDAHDLIRDADQATYRAKELGKGRVQFFDLELRHRMEERASLQRQIRDAIDEGQFELYVQPVFALEQGTGDPALHAVTRAGWGTRIAGGEALVRWNRPDVGVVLPGEFIPVAEESWLIVELGQFMLRRACALLTRWQAAGLQLHLSVNVSGRHVVDGAFVRDVRSILDATGADPHGLVLEITESHLLTDLDTAAAALAQLRALGVRVALDDFGTGYASLSYLRQLPIDVMKIDRAYVKDLVDDAAQAPILENLLRLGEILGLSVVAEGVETEAQLHCLQAMGCGSVQGFLLARPMQVAAFEAFVGLDTTTPAVVAGGGPLALQQP
ncbi:MAG: putative bifunctional diguanylate cyclase/phosphodiesterase [Acidimicrobiia bacterium]